MLFLSCLSLSLPFPLALLSLSLSCYNPHSNHLSPSLFTLPCHLHLHPHPILFYDYIYMYISMLGPIVTITGRVFDVDNVTTSQLLVEYNSTLAPWTTLVVSVNAAATMGTMALPVSIRMKRSFWPIRKDVHCYYPIYTLSLPHRSHPVLH